MFDRAHVVGLTGNGLMTVTDARNSMAKALNLTFFNALNLTASLLLIYSLTIHSNIASLSLEVVWAIIAVIGLAKALRKGKLS